MQKRYRETLPLAALVRKAHGDIMSDCMCLSETISPFFAGLRECL